MSITIQASRGVPLGDRSVVATKHGIPWWGAVLGAFAMTGVGIAIDLALGDTLTSIFLVFYAVGCVGAVLAVAHRGIFAAMVQPPLILAIAVPLVVRALGTNSSGGGLRDEVITMALPLVNGFPTMALTTLATVALGVARIVIQRRAYPQDTPERVAANQATYRPRGAVQPRRSTGTRPKAAAARAARIARPAAAPGPAAMQDKPKPTQPAPTPRGGV